MKYLLLMNYDYNLAILVDIARLKILDKALQHFKTALTLIPSTRRKSTILKNIERLKADPKGGNVKLIL